jgi:hypothetical protein
VKWKRRVPSKQSEQPTIRLQGATAHNIIIKIHIAVKISIPHESLLVMPYQNYCSKILCKLLYNSAIKELHSIITYCQASKINLTVLNALANYVKKSISYLDVRPVEESMTNSKMYNATILHVMATSEIVQTQRRTAVNILLIAKQLCAWMMIMTTIMMIMMTMMMVIHCYGKYE